MDILDRIQAVSETDDPGVRIGVATVTSAAAGTFSDGRKKITVDWRGAAIDCAYLASYTPAVGHNVTFFMSGSSFLVLGQAAH